MTKINPITGQKPSKSLEGGFMHVTVTQPDSQKKKNIPIWLYMVTIIFTIAVIISTIVFTVIMVRTLYLIADNDDKPDNSTIGKTSFTTDTG